MELSFIKYLNSFKQFVHSERVSEVLSSKTNIRPQWVFPSQENTSDQEEMHTRLTVDSMIVFY